MTIQETLQKFKGFGLERLVVPATVVVVGVASFGLGRLSAHEVGKAGLSVFYPKNYEEMLPASSGNALSEREGAADASGIVVASKAGTKYHYPWCTGAKSISEANRITFASIEEARKAGYAPAGNCKGLQ